MKSRFFSNTQPIRLANIQLLLTGCWVCLFLINIQNVKAQADLVINPDQITVASGDTFEIAVQVKVEGTDVVAAEVHLDFDPSIVKVVALTPTDLLSLAVIAPIFDNTQGTIDYAAGTPTNNPNQTFTLLTIQFTALQKGNTAISYAQEQLRASNVTSYTDFITGELIPGQVSVGAAITNAGLSQITCNDNQTPALATDDRIAFELNPEASPTLVSISEGYLLSATQNGIQVINRENPSPYGTTTIFVLPDGTAGKGNVLLTLTDVQDPSCTIQVELQDPGTCAITTSSMAATLSADPTQIIAPTQTVTFTFEISNTGNTPLSITSLEDSQLGDVTDPLNPNLTSTTCNAISSIDIAQTLTCSYSAILTSQPGETLVHQLAIEANDPDSQTKIADNITTTVTVRTETLPCNIQTVSLSPDINTCIVEGDPATISAIPFSTSPLPDGYQTLYLLTKEETQIIIDSSTNPTFTIDTADAYQIHPLTYDPNIFTPGDLIDLYQTSTQILTDTIETLGYCTAFDTQGTSFEVTICTCDIQPITLASNTASCLLEGSSTTLSATVLNTEITAKGFQTLYLLTTRSGADQVVIDTLRSPSFTVDTIGLYQIYPLTYNPKAFALDGIITLNQTTIAELNVTLNAQNECAVLNTNGAEFEVITCICELESPVLLPNTTECLLLEDSLIISAKFQGPTAISSDLETRYLLSRGGEQILIDISTKPEFFVSEADSFYLHTLTYEKGTGVDDFVNAFLGGTLDQFLASLNPSQTCVAVDTEGILFEISYCEGSCNSEAGTLVPNDTICIASDQPTPIQLTATVGVPPTIPPNHLTLYLLSKGDEKLIQATAPAPAFSLTDPGIYRIHTLVYQVKNFDLSLIEIGNTPIGDLSSIISFNQLCADLDAIGARFELDTCSSQKPIPITPDPTLDVDTCSLTRLITYSLENQYNQSLNEIRNAIVWNELSADVDSLTAAVLSSPFVWENPATLTIIDDSIGILQGMMYNLQDPEARIDVLLEIIDLANDTTTDPTGETSDFPADTLHTQNRDSLPSSIIHGKLGLNSRLKGVNHLEGTLQVPHSESNPQVLQVSREVGDDVIRYVLKGDLLAQGQLIYQTDTMQMQNPVQLHTYVSTIDSTCGMANLSPYVENFEAEPLLGGINLVWQSLLPGNMGYVALERSIDEQIFEAIYITSDDETSLSQRRYTFQDVQARFSDQYFYRLKIVKGDGSFYYSRTISVQLTQATTEEIIRVYPNPISDHKLYVLPVTLTQDPLRYDLVDMRGRSVKGGAIIPNTENAIEIVHPAPGMYTLVIYQKDERLSSHLIAIQ